MSSQYPNSGALFTSTNKRNDRAPDMFGTIEIEKDYLLAMLEKAAGTPFVSIKLDGWLKKDKNDNRMVSLKINTYEKGAAPAQASAKDPWDD
jgi:hypothetical protein